VVVAYASGVSHGRNAGLAAYPAVATAVGATVGTDTLSLAVLAAVAGSATGSLSGITLVVAIVAGLAILGVWCLVILPLLGRFFYTHIGFHPTIPTRSSSWPSCRPRLSRRSLASRPLWAPRFNRQPSWGAQLPSCSHIQKARHRPSTSRRD